MHANGARIANVRTLRCGICGWVLLRANYHPPASPPPPVLPYLFTSHPDPSSSGLALEVYTMHYATTGVLSGRGLSTLRYQMLAKHTHSVCGVAFYAWRRMVPVCGLIYCETRMRFILRSAEKRSLLFFCCSPFAICCFPFPP